ncbi:MAG: nSTAND1 domain-containing NTPase [Anaerolineales bacterium]
MPTQPFTPESFTSFGDLLKYLRRRERLTQLELSITVGYSEAQITRLEKNQRLPDVAALKALFVPALHLEDEPELTARFLRLAQSARQEDAPAMGVAPYKGLLFFDRADSELFFGRETLTTHLARWVTDLAMDASSRFLAIVGASGSGKSSLVRAGLAVALQRAGWEIHILTPTLSPLKMLAANFTLRSARNNGQHLILVDQFEEAFTLCRDENERSTFIERLLSIARNKSARTTVVIALRADFYSHCAHYPLLREAVAAEQEYIGQMTREELRRAIEEPAKHGGWEFEPGLVEVLLDDIGADGTGQPEPGALPLLSHALLATWERRRGRTLTLDGYRATGGVRGAIAETAESVFTDQLNRSQQDLARDIFLRLTELGEGTEDTRRRAALNELLRQSEEAPQLRAVLNTLAEARLITLNEDSAEVAHEALIREWQRLQEWLAHDREGLLLHRHLTNSAHEWEARGRDAAELYRGARLAQMREWASANEERLNASERAFIEASVEHEQQDALEREAQRQRELKAAKELAETQSRAAKQLRRRAVFLATAFVLAVALAGVAIFFGNQANQNATKAQQNAVSAQQNAAIANASAKQAESEKRLATSRELAAASLSNLNVDPERSVLLALQAVTVTYAVDKSVLPEAEDALHRAVLASRARITLCCHNDAVVTAAYSPDGKKIATASQDGTVKIWDALTGIDLMTLGEVNESDAVNFLAYSPDGTRIVTGHDDHTARVWDTATGRVILTLVGHSDYVNSVAYSPQGTHIATASGDNTVKMWDAVTGRELYTLSDVNQGPDNIAFSPDGKRFATAGADKTAITWDVATGRELARFLGHTSSVNMVAFSPDDTRIATVSSDNTARVWDAATGTQELVLNLAASGLAVGFSPDGKRLATAGFDGTATVWDVLSGKQLLTLNGHTSAIYDVSFSADGTRLTTASRDHTAKVWDLAPSRELLTIVAADPPGIVSSLAYSPDGKRLATSNNHQGRLWDPTTGKLLLTLLGHSSDTNRVVFSPDGTRLATSSDDQTAKIWDAFTGKALLTLTGNTDRVRGTAFSPDGKYLATASDDGTARLWDAETGRETLRESWFKFATDTAFSPNGKYIVTAGVPNAGDTSLRTILWDAATGQKLAALSSPGKLPTAMAFSPDGKQLALGYVDGSIKVSGVSANGLHVTELYSPIGHSGSIEGIAYSPDGKRLASASDDGTTKIWDSATGQGLLTLSGLNGGVNDVAFGPDGAHLATGGRDGTVRIYLLRIEDLVALAKSRLTRSFTTEECQQYLHVAACPTAP